MHETYEHLRITVKPRTWLRVVAHITTVGAQAVEQAGGRLYGVWISQIGLPFNQGVVLCLWPDRDTKSPVLEGAPDLIDAAAKPLVATVRPTDPTPPTRPGVYMHRWFGLESANWDEFLALSEAAWPNFERSYESEIIGFWRSLTAPASEAHALLITRYPSYAMWERSRGGNVQSRKGSDDWQRFVRRHELTDSMTVSAMDLVSMSL